jgi:hypothetical protein
VTTEGNCCAGCLRYSKAHYTRLSVPRFRPGCSLTAVNKMWQSSVEEASKGAAVMPSSTRFAACAVMRNSCDTIRHQSVTVRPSSPSYNNTQTHTHTHTHTIQKKTLTQTFAVVLTHINDAKTLSQAQPSSVRDPLHLLPNL